MTTPTSFSRGITSLIAVVVMSVAMTTALGIYQLLFSEFLIARDQEYSIVAEYAAHSGIECALYNLYAENYDVTADPNLRCNGSNISSGGLLRTYTYPMTENNACTIVSLEYVDNNAAVPPHRTITIRSRGRYPCSTPRVERGIETTLRRRCRLVGGICGTGL